MNSSKKILILGDAGVGKTSFIDYYLGNKFEEKYISTHGFSIKKPSKYILYDFPGQEKYSSHNINLKDIDICIIMYDVTNKLSYKNIKFWKVKLKKLCGNIPTIIIGNKIDSKSRKIIDNNTINISIKTQNNIHNLFKSNGTYKTLLKV